MQFLNYFLTNQIPSIKDFCSSGIIHGPLVKGVPSFWGLAYAGEDEADEGADFWLTCSGFSWLSFMAYFSFNAAFNLSSSEGSK